MPAHLRPTHRLLPCPIAVIILVNQHNALAVWRGTKKIQDLLALNLQRAAAST